MPRWYFYVRGTLTPEVRSALDSADFWDVNDGGLTLVPPLPPPPTEREVVQDALDALKRLEELPRLFAELQADTAKLQANNAEMRAANDRMLATIRGGES